MERFIKWFMKLFWQLPMVWRFKYKHYHEQYIPVEIKEEKKLPTLFKKPKDWHFRCPHCGQAHVFQIDEFEDFRLIQDYRKGDFDLKLFWSVRSGPHSDFAQEFSVPGEKMIELVDKYLVQPLSLIYCRKCKKDAPVWQWNQAFHEPLLYFEIEHICHCGGEMYFINEPYTQRYGLVCETCNWLKPEVRISGGESDE